MAYQNLDDSIQDVVALSADEQREGNQSDDLAVRNSYRTMQNIVYKKLLDEILSGRLGPGERLNTSELAERLGVSRTPIREALNQLFSIGLAERIPHRGAFVKKLSVGEVIELYYIRAALEGAAARLATSNFTDDEIRRLSDLCDSMEQYLAEGDHQAILGLNYDFHSTIYQAARSPRLEALIMQYYGQSEQYRALGLELPGRYAEICAEHRAILSAFQDRDRDRAEFHAREHHFNTARRIARYAGSSIEI